MVDLRRIRGGFSANPPPVFFAFYRCIYFSVVDVVDFIRKVLYGKKVSSVIL
nr:MAG TPA: hypothetical protein [Caudoviricetes sp.]